MGRDWPDNYRIVEVTYMDLTRHPYIVTDVESFKSDNDGCSFVVNGTEIVIKYNDMNIRRVFTRHIQNLYQL